MNTVRVILILVFKDLRLELRTLPGTMVSLLLAVVTVAVLAMGLGPGGGATGGRSSAVLWAAYLFGGVLVFDKSMAAERRDDALAALLFAPLDRGTLFLAKLLANLVILGLVAAVVTLLGALFFGIDPTASSAAFLRTTTLGLLGFGAIGTLFGAAVGSARFQGGLLAVLVFPLAIPIVLVSTRAAQGAEHGEALLLSLATVFVVSGWLLYEPLLEA
jgi:heme exporter protein B